MYGNPEDLINHLKQILNIKQQINLEMETPPQSPNFVNLNNLLKKNIFYRVKIWIPRIII